ncbi:hypothetical protein ACKUDU_29110, partial [Klebsiella pneumoniae]|uniref:hypothetical protein n=1 Tax=Klebsiella pneumoniae TaxID=573 RepID=UPI003CF47CD8
KRAYCLKTQPATGETYPKSDLFNKAIRHYMIRLSDLQQGALRNNIFYEEFISFFNHQEVSHET